MGEGSHSLAPPVALLCGGALGQARGGPPCRVSAAVREGVTLRGGGARARRNLSILFLQLPVILQLCQM